jgi:uncharacterized protein
MTILMIVRPLPSQVVSLLIDRGAALEATDKDGNTALMLAAKEGNKKTVALLLARGADASKI